MFAMVKPRHAAMALATMPSGALNGGVAGAGAGLR